MSASEIVYTARAPYPDVLERGRAQVVNLPTYRDGVAAAPASGTFTLWSPSQVAIVLAQAVTITSNVATYSIAAVTLPATLALGEGYLEEWALVMPDGTTRTYRRAAALALRSLYPVYSDIDALAEYPGIQRDIASSATSLQGYVDEAWRQILARLAERRVYPYLVMTADSFRDVHRHMTLHLVFKSYFRGVAGTGEKWSELMRYHGEGAEKAWTSLTAQIDHDHDGYVDSEARERASTIVHVNAAGPQRAFFHRYTV